MESGTAIQILGVIVQTYASVLAIGAGFFTFLVQRYIERVQHYQEEIKKKENSKRYYEAAASLIRSRPEISRERAKVKRIYRLFIIFFILCIIIIALSFILMGIAESIPSEILNFWVWFVEGMATVGFGYIMMFAWSLLHLD